MKKSCSSYVFVVASIIASTFQYLSQSPTTYIRNFNFPDYTSGKSIYYTQDGGWVVCGELKTTMGGPSDYYIYKLSSCNNLQYFRTLGSSGNDAPQRLIQSSDGGFIIAGRYDDGGGNNYDFSLLKTDMFGNLIWHTMWDNNNAYDIANDVIQANANFIVAGGTNNFPYNGWNGVLSKYGNNGAHIWTKAIGGSGTDRLESVSLVVGGNNIIAAGFTSSFGAGQNDILLVNMDVFGNINWIKTYGTSANEGGFEKVSVYALPSGYLIASSSNNTTLTNGGEDILLIKTDLNGNVLWAKLYGGIGNEYAKKVYPAFNNGIILVGTTNSYTNGDNDATILRLDNNGNIIWAKSYGRPGCDMGEDVISFSNGYGLVITYNSNLTPCGLNNEFDPMIVKMDTSGIAGCLTINASYTPINITSNIIVNNISIAVASQDISGNVTLFAPVPAASVPSISENFNCLSCVPTTPSFTAPTNVCAEDLIILQNQSVSSGNVCFQWNINNNYVSNKDTVIVQLNPGNYIVELQSVCGNTVSSLQQNIVVNPKPTANFNFTNNICIDKMPVNYINAGTSGPGITYQWYLGAGASPATSSSPNANNIIYSYPGIKNVAFVVSNSYGCKDSVVKQVSIEPKPSLDFLLSKNPVCINDTFSIVNTSWIGTGGNINLWYWNFGDGNTSNIKNPIHSYSSAGNYTIMLVGTSDYGCDDTLFKTINIASMSAGGNIVPNSTVVCEGQNMGILILNGFNGNILYWEYSTDGGNTWSVISNTSSIQGYYNINSTTLYNAVVQNYPCPFVHSNTVTVQADKKSVGGLLLSDTVVCFGSNTGTLSVTNYSTTIIDWIYSTDGGNNWISLNNTNPFFVFSNLNQNTQYAVIVKNGVCPEDTSNIVNINVNMFNTAQVFPTDTSISLGYSLQIIASGGTQYNWYPNYNISDTGIYNPYVYPYKDTVYKVIVTNQYGCVDTASVRIFVKKDYNLVIANTITPNGDNLNDYFWIGFIENYPNNEVIIFNRYGQEIFKGTNYDNKKVYWDGTYQGNKVPDGAYYYVIKFKDTDVVFKGSINVISSR